MSRIGKQPIAIPEKTEVVVSSDSVHVKGPHGELSRALHPLVAVAVKDGSVETQPSNTSKAARALWGTYASLIRSMVRGVNDPFEKKLAVEGVGYRVTRKENELELNVGFSHSVTVPIPESVNVSVEKNEITISGVDKEVVGQFAAVVRAVKKPEPYKGKGIRYHDEVIRRKQGKRAVA